MLLLMLACAVCRGDLVAEDPAPLAPGEAVAFAFTWAGEEVDPCGVHWLVEGVEGGDEAVGTVDACGRYTAPASPPAEDPVLLAAEYLPGTCADCCPAASAAVALAR